MALRGLSPLQEDQFRKRLARNQLFTEGGTRSQRISQLPGTFCSAASANFGNQTRQNDEFFLPRRYHDMSPLEKSLRANL